MYKLSVCFCLAAFLWIAHSSAAVDKSTIHKPKSSADQRTYQLAIKAIRRGKHDQAKAYRSQLANYPLAIYLDYYLLGATMRQVDDAQAREFIKRSQGTPLSARFKARYVKQLGRRQDWQTFLTFQSGVPRRVELQCYYYRAKAATGDTDLAWAGAKQMWLYGRSRPKACDPLFKSWRRAGQLTDSLIWQRMLLAFEARQRSLLAYLARQGSASLKRRSQLLLQVYNKPATVLRTPWSTRSSYANQIVALGLKRLAWRRPEQALRHWQALAQKQGLSAAQKNEVMRALASRIISKEINSGLHWLDNSALVALADDSLLARRLRWMLAEQNWQGMEKLLPLLSPSERNKSRWRYWLAMVSKQKGDDKKARKLLQALAKERGYYAFLAAEAVGQPYDMNNNPPQPIPHNGVFSADKKSIARIGELLFHNDTQFALMEWHQLLTAANAHQRAALAQLALDKGWYRMAIEAANKAGEHDWLAMRFPQPYSAEFEKHARHWNVSKTELMSIARRESAFLPEARSAVGARGLMQLMPATGKQVARKLGRRYRVSGLYDIEENITLGSAYYKELLDRYQGNRVLALAAYNAGMHRVDRWHKEDHATLPVSLWVDTIPFKETRAYVQAVLFYNVVFAHLLGEDAPLFTRGERKRVY